MKHTENYGKMGSDFKRYSTEAGLKEKNTEDARMKLIDAFRDLHELDIPIELAIDEALDSLGINRNGGFGR